MLTIAFIGNGKSTNRYHLPFVQKLPDKIKVKTIYSRSETPWKKRSDVIYTNHLEDVLVDPEIDLVVVTTPASAHYTLAKQVLEAGKHALVEKPFTETLTEAEELFKLAASKNLIIQAYQNRRYDSDFLTVQRVIESGKLGDLLEVEMHYDYFRPEVPEQVTNFSKDTSYLYGHACHTIDQVVSYFGLPDHYHLEVRALLGQGRMNDYFDLDFFYDKLKVSIKSSYFRIKPRPSFVLYGKKGMFIKETKDRQEEHLKLFYMPDHTDFGLDLPEHYGTLTYMDELGHYHEEKVISEVGDYSRVYESLYHAIMNGKPKVIKDEETLFQLKVLEEGVQQMKESRY
ncbi:Gfo/Idh/MocA family oxidoreductase [Streptococcus ovis]|uniref:Gfo/Idh/MocA family oxidoreductase n=1 Tax=Streptococcus ovis TaxID=82806 RepID=UPI00037B1280|nr:Gfo/Idh/MocA family oxidoreductase [Streptococcus ovis]